MRCGAGEHVFLTVFAAGLALYAVAPDSLLRMRLTNKRLFRSSRLLRGVSPASRLVYGHDEADFFPSDAAMSGKSVVHDPSQIQAW